MNAPLPSPSAKKARIEIIPLIDVVFFLLATFVLFTLSLDLNRVLTADLPKAGERPTGPDDTTAYVQASAAGTYWKQGSDDVPALLSDAELRVKLLQFRDDVGAPRVLVRSDATATFGDAVRVLDEVRRAGVRQVAVETVASKPGR